MYTIKITIHDLSIFKVLDLKCVQTAKYVLEYKNGISDFDSSHFSQYSLVSAVVATEDQFLDLLDNDSPSYWLH
jgi:hypothetical protein